MLGVEYPEVANAGLLLLNLEHDVLLHQAVLVSVVP
jgi:hypothetical protein